MNSLEDILSIPSYIINLDKSKERLINTFNLLEKAKFKNIIRFKAIDGNTNDLEKLFAKLIPNYEFEEWDGLFKTVKGKQGCFLSHFLLWDHIISNKIPYANIFEDDIKFHDSWSLAEFYINNTPSDFDMIFMGSKVMYKPTNFISNSPCYCTHAYILSYNGALKLKNYFSKTPIFTIDCKLYELMENIIRSRCQQYFKWYVWNTNDFNDLLLLSCTSNNGLILQDETFQSVIISNKKEIN